MDALVKLAYRLDRLWKRALGTTQRGVQAIALAPDGRIILVSLRYLAGWHLPGGGAKRNESSVDAVLREMREETSMLSYARITSLGMVHEKSSGVSTDIEVFLIEGVELGPPPEGNFEVRTIAFWNVNDLPAKSDVARARLARFGLA
jgi:ADP-ribose pyrophosphatase YjhB (NUDIX family)